MLMIRLQRVGRKHETFFRIVVVDSRRGPKSGRAVEVLGSYDPRRGKPILKADKIKHWISLGAQVSDTTHNLLIDTKILTGAKINVLPKRKTKPKTEAPAEATKPTPTVTAPETEAATQIETPITTEVEPAPSL